MVDTSKILEIAPHYVAMVVCAVILVSSVRFVLGRSAIVVEFVGMFLIAFAYPFTVRRAGYAPDSWQ
ncbi:MAG: hypothetical protein A07HR60_00430 [uncultured archaeon A07HR60]|jgi:hypothetical protein|nr:MAG: hypothetical protein A07HR60_00430 [uncultured archaeon A07HR60]